MTPNQANRRARSFAVRGDIESGTYDTVRRLASIVDQLLVDIRSFSPLVPAVPPMLAQRASIETLTRFDGC